MAHDEVIAEVRVAGETDVVRVRQTARLLALALALPAEAEARFSAMAANVAAYVAADCEPAYLRFWVGMVDEWRHGLGLEVTCRRRDGACLDARAAEQAPALSTALGLASRASLAPLGADTLIRLHESLPAGETPERSAIDTLRGQLGHSARCVALSTLRRQHQDLLARLLVLQQRHSAASRASQAGAGGESQRWHAALDALDVHASELARLGVANTAFGAAPDLRGPLVHIHTLAGQMLACPEDELTAEQRMHARLIHEAGGELLALVDEFGDLARVETGAPAPRAEAFDVAQLYGSLEAAFAPLPLRPEVELTFEMPPAGQQVVRSDRHKVAQVLRELIVNALKFTLQGRVRVSSRAAGEAVHLEVADSGIGIPARDLETVFHEAHAMRDEALRRNPGDGLGLALARRLTSAIGARIDVASQVDAGSVFALVLPVCEARGERRFAAGR